MSFAHLNRIHSLNPLRLCGPCGANDEFLLAASAQNLNKLAKWETNPMRTRKPMENGSAQALSAFRDCKIKPVFQQIGQEADVCCANAQPNGSP